MSKKISLENLYTEYLIPYVLAEQAAGARKVELDEAIEYARDAASADGYTKLPGSKSIYTNIRKPKSAKILKDGGVALYGGGQLIPETLRDYWDTWAAALDHGLKSEQPLYEPLATWLERRYSGASPVPYMTLTPWAMKDGRAGAPDIVGYPVFAANTGSTRTITAIELVAIDAKRNMANWNVDVGTTASYRRFAHRAYLAYPLISPVRGQATMFFDDPLVSMCRKLGIGLLAVTWPTRKSVGLGSSGVEVVVEAESMSVPPVDCDSKIQSSWGFVANNPDTRELREPLKRLMSHYRRELKTNQKYTLQLDEAKKLVSSLKASVATSSLRMDEAVLTAWVIELNRFRHFFLA